MTDLDMEWENYFNDITETETIKKKKKMKTLYLNVLIYTYLHVLKLVL